MNEFEKNLIWGFAHGSRRITALTGAGISAESGIPTFRGADGYWTVGSRNYRPEEMATIEMFGRHPDEVWQWYLYRFGVCGRAAPNPGHLALAAMEDYLGERFALITQNVDGLHLRAGNSRERTYEVHGNAGYMRCAIACDEAVYPLPPEIKPKEKDEALTDSDRRLLVCPRCGGRSRPHILFFDECYNECHYRAESALELAHDTGLLIVVGCSGKANMPFLVANEVVMAGGNVINIDINENPFSKIARNRGMFIQEPSAQVLPQLLAAMRGV
jgi:NAD-dependent deacetylase